MIMNHLHLFILKLHLNSLQDIEKHRDKNSYSYYQTRWYQLRISQFVLIKDRKLNNTDKILLTRIFAKYSVIKTSHEVFTRQANINHEEEANIRLCYTEFSFSRQTWSTSATTWEKKNHEIIRKDERSTSTCHLRWNVCFDPYWICAKEREMLVNNLRDSIWVLR